MKLVCPTVLTALLTACVTTRKPEPIAMKVAGDDGRTCEDIAAECRNNTEVAAAKIGRNEINDVKDFWFVVFVWPGAGDYQNADGVEGNALLDRNIYLRNLAQW